MRPPEPKLPDVKPFLPEGEKDELDKCQGLKMKGKDGESREHGDLQLVIEDFHKCLLLLEKLRTVTLDRGQIYAEWNKKVHRQYQKVVDEGNLIDLNVSLEKAMTQQRERESYYLLREMEKIETSRRQLWSPVWQSVGLWPDFKPDPRRNLEERNLPYVGGRAQPVSTVDMLIKNLSTAEKVRVRRLTSDERASHDKINELEKRLLTTKLSSEEARELAALKEIRAELNEQKKNTNFNRVKTTLENGQWVVHTESMENQLLPLVWTAKGITWANEPGQESFRDLPMKDFPTFGSPLIAQQLAICRKKKGEYFDPVHYIGKFFEVRDVLAEEMQTKWPSKYKWGDVEGLLRYFPNLKQLEYVRKAEKGGKIHPDWIQEIESVGKQKMAQLAVWKYVVVEETDEAEKVDEADVNNPKYWWTAKGIVWAIQTRMFPTIPWPIGSKVDEVQLEILTRVLGSTGKINLLAADKRLSKHELSVEEKAEFVVVDRWTNFGFKMLDTLDPLKKINREHVSPGAIFREFHAATIYQHGRLTRRDLRENGCIVPADEPTKDLSEEQLRNKFKNLGSDPSSRQPQISREAAQFNLRKTTDTAGRENLETYCATLNGGNIILRAGWATLKQHNRGGEDVQQLWADLHMTEDCWDGYLPLGKCHDWSKYPKLENLGALAETAKKLGFTESTWQLAAENPGTECIFLKGQGLSHALRS